MQLKDADPSAESVSKVVVAKLGPQLDRLIEVRAHVYAKYGWRDLTDDRAIQSSMERALEMKTTETVMMLRASS